MRISLLLATLIMAGCRAKETARVEQKAVAPLSITASVVAGSQISSSYEAAGTVRARVSATVSAKLMSYAKEVRAGIGDHVSAGQPLVLLDSRDQEAVMRQAEAVRDELRNASVEAESAIVAAQSQLDLVQLTFGRMQDLLNKRSVTQQEFDEASARLKAARAALDMARARRTQLDAKLAQAEQGIHIAGIQQSYTTVTAPFSGIVLEKSIEPGSLVVPGTPLFTMERDSGFRFEANVEESQLGSIRVGQMAAVIIDDRAAQGRVSEIVPVVDAASRTGVVKIDLRAIPNLRSGLFGRARFEKGNREALMIPKSAVIERGQLQSVYVVENHSASLRLVTLGEQTRGQIEVLSGLREGEIIVTPIPAGLRDGAPVEVRR